LAFGLTDSPAGLAAWIVEKFRTWSDNDGMPESAVSRDRLLANIAFYWFTAAIGSSFWPYYGRLHFGLLISPDHPVTVPTGYAAFAKEIIVPPGAIAEKTYTNIQRWTEMKRAVISLPWSSRLRLPLKSRISSGRFASLRPKLLYALNQNDHVPRRPPNCK
jgi:hypothetical protein